MLILLKKKKKESWKGLLVMMGSNESKGGSRQYGVGTVTYTWVLEQYVFAQWGGGTGGFANNNICASIVGLQRHSQDIAHLQAIWTKHQIIF